MTREEAADILEEILRLNPRLGQKDHPAIEAMKVALTALCPISREKVEKLWRGEWRDLHGDKLIGIDDWGQDVYRHYHYSVCKKCGKGIAAKSNFCPYCGDAKTDKAVQMVMERWEALTNVKTD